MTDKEIVQALRCCRLGKPCTSCPAAGRGKEVCSFDEVHAAAVATIERLTAENAALREKQRWIPVAERLPEPETDVLAVCNRNGYIGWQAPEGGVRALPKDQGGVCPGV